MDSRRPSSHWLRLSRVWRRSCLTRRTSASTWVLSSTASCWDVTTCRPWTRTTPRDSTTWPASWRPGRKWCHRRAWNTNSRLVTVSNSWRPGRKWCHRRDWNTNSRLVTVSNSWRPRRKWCHRRDWNTNLRLVTTGSDVTGETETRIWG